jgi:PAS domain S-box-containing protein
MSVEKSRLLIVEDDREWMNALRETFSPAGFGVSGFASGEEALDALRGERFDILLVDLSMPGLDGLQLLSKALELDPHLIGVLMADPGAALPAPEAMQEGAFSLIIKPCPPQSLLPLLSRALELRRLREENADLQATLSAYKEAQAISSGRDASTLQTKLIDSAMEMCQADEASLMLPLPSGEGLVIAAVESLERSDLLGRTIYFDQGVAGWVARHCEPIVLEGANKDQQFITMRRRPEVHASISLPLLSGGKLVAVLNLNARHRRPPFTSSELKCLGILASAAAAALENASSQQKLQQSEELYRSIFANASGGVYRSTPQGRFLAVNPALVWLLGYDSVDDLLKSVADIGRQMFIEPERRQELMALLGHQDEVRGFESQVRRKDGTALWVSENVTAIREIGSLVCLQGRMEDISQRRRVLENLQRSEEKLRVLFETIALGVIYQDHHGRIISANPAAPRILGLELDQILGRSVTDSRWQNLQEDGSPLPEERHPTMVALASGEEAPSTVLGIYNLARDEVRWVNVNAFPLFGPGGNLPVQVCTTFEDITELKKGERV